MITTTTRPTISGRAAAERLLAAIDEKALSVADAAMTAGLPVAEVEGLLHLRPSRLSAETAARLAAALRVTLPAGHACPAWCQVSDADHAIEGARLPWFMHHRQVARTTRAVVDLAQSQCVDEDAASEAVRVIHLTLSAGPLLTPSEARTLAAALVEAAALAEG